MGTSAWLISRAALHPSEASLTLAIVGRAVLRALARLPPLRRAAGRARRRPARAGRPARACLRPARGDRPGRPPALPPGRPRGPGGRRRRLAPGRRAAGHPALRRGLPRRGGAPSPSCGCSCPARAPCCWWPSSSRPRWCRGSPGAWPGGRSPSRRRRGASSPRRWSTSIEGAPELTVMGGTGEQLDADRRGRSPPARRRHARARARPASVSASPPPWPGWPAGAP